MDTIVVMWSIRLDDNNNIGLVYFSTRRHSSLGNVAAGKRKVSRTGPQAENIIEVFNRG